MSEGRRNGIAIAVAAGALLAAWLLAAGLRAAPLERLSTTVAGDVTLYRGSWHFPRGGPYILGVQGPPTARLSIDGDVLDTRAWRGRPDVRLARKVYAPGVYAVELRAPPGTRLLWHPPGRRGPPEYVPASSLAPDPPARASFSHPGVYRVEAFAAAGMLGVLFALLVYLTRNAWAGADRRALAAAVAVFVVAVAIRLFDLDGAGQTWDEDVNWSAGRNYVLNLFAGDFEPRSWIWNYEHPPVTKYIAGIGALWSDGYNPARALSALLVAAACALLVPIGQRLFSLRVGALAGAIAGFTPHLIAHGKVVGHEAPAVLAWTVAVWLCLRAFDYDESEVAPSSRRLAARFAIIGLALGFAIWSRFANGLLAPLVGLLLVALAPAKRRREVVVLGLAVIPVVALLVGVALWPRLWQTPFANLGEAWARLSKPHDPEPYLGAVTNRPPWHYFWVYVAATTPLLVWLGALAAPFRRPRPGSSWLVLALWFTVPFGVMASPVRQDGVRYVLPALMPLAVASAVGFDAATAWLGRRRRVLAPVVPAGLGLYLVVTAAFAHPYYLDYYGEQVGGTAGAFERRWFETGWWGQGIDAAIDYLNTHAEPGATVDKRRLHPAHLTWMRHDLWAPQARRGPFPAPDADWLLVNQWPFSPPDNWELVHEVTAGGAPLVHVYRPRER